MQVSPGFRMIFLLMSIFLFLTGCNMPRDTNIPEQQPGAIDTAAAQTVAVYLTQSASQGQTLKTSTPVPNLLATGTVVVTSASDGESGDSGQDVPEICDRVRFVEDVTVPDGEEFPPQARFVKTWLLENAGTCAWTSAYSLVFERGDAMSGPASKQFITGEIAPGEQVEVSVELAAPPQPGSYQGFWKLRNAKGQRFGIGEEAKSFWVKIEVVEESE